MSDVSGPSLHTPAALLGFLKSQLSHPPLSTDGPVSISDADAARFRNIALSLSQFLVTDLHNWDNDFLQVALEALEVIDRTILKIPAVLKAVDGEDPLHSVLVARLLELSINICHGDTGDTNVICSAPLGSSLELKALDVVVHVVRALPGKLSSSEREQQLDGVVLDTCLRDFVKSADGICSLPLPIVYPLQIQLFNDGAAMSASQVLDSLPQSSFITIVNGYQRMSLALALLHVIIHTIYPYSASSGFLSSHDASSFALFCSAWDQLEPYKSMRGTSDLEKKAQANAKLFGLTKDYLEMRHETVMPRDAAKLLAHIERWTRQRLEEGLIPEAERSDQLLETVWMILPPFALNWPNIPLGYITRGEDIALSTGLRGTVYAYLERALPFLSAETLSHLHPTIATAVQCSSRDSVLAAIDIRLQGALGRKQPQRDQVFGKRKRDESSYFQESARRIVELFELGPTSVSDEGIDEIETFGEIMDKLNTRFTAPLPVGDLNARLRLAESLSQLPCLLFHHNSSSCSTPTSVPTTGPQSARFLPFYIHGMAKLLDSGKDVPPSMRLKLLDGLGKAIRHSGGGLALQKDTDIVSIIRRAMERDERSVRMSAGRIAIELFNMYRLIGREASIKAHLLMSVLVELVEGRTRAMVRETTLVALAAIGRTADQEIVSRVLACLLAQLGHENSLLKALAYIQLQSLAKFHSKSVYSLMSPYFPQISVFLVEKIVSSPQILSETCQLISLSRHDFLSLTLAHTLPSLIAKCRRDVLDAISKELGKNLAAMCLQAAHEILAHIFLLQTEVETDTGISFLLAIVGEAAGKGAMVSVATLVKSCMVPLLAELVIALGHDENSRVQLAIEALKRVERRVVLPVKGQRRAPSYDLASFLKAHMLGIISHLNDVLQDVQGKKTATVKKQVIRSLGSLIELVGPSMSSVSPQIMATLHSTLGIDGLREEVLVTWRTFICKLSLQDIGSYVGQTTAAFISDWQQFTELERQLAKHTIDYLVQHGEDLGSHLNDIVALNHAPELEEAHEHLLVLRADQTPGTRLLKLLDRSTSENATVTMQALKELKQFMLDNREFIESLASGDAFDPAIANIVKTLLTAACRDGDACEPLRVLAYECIGILGAVDPDRFEMSFEDTTMIVLHNFNDENENVTFVLHLIRDLLVGAFRSTSDIKYQSHLAFAIQELLRICDFRANLVVPGVSTAVPMKVRTRWNSLPKHVLETISPLLEGRFTLNNKPLPEIRHPIYAGAPTYREWIQIWTAYLITRVSAPDAKKIFEVFRSAVRNQDVGVAHHLLPHIVLNVLITGDNDDCDMIRLEIVTVLEDQVNPRIGVAGDRRTLSAQTIFSLMDHLSRWIRMVRQETNQKRSESKRFRQGGNASNLGAEMEEQLIRVESMLSSIDQELMARAAFHCRYFARALLSFEQRIVSLHTSGMSDLKLQPYYDSLHQIYAELDEPDGMAGISTKVIAPSLEHQIRAHETTGRWTSAQSCWEVKLQGSPDDVDLHLGLLRCLRNLGHYDTLRTHVKGVLSRKPEWTGVLAAFEVEGAWMVGDWRDVEELVSNSQADTAELHVARVLLAVRANNSMAFSRALQATRLRLGDAISTAGKHAYRGSYEAVVGLHVLHELELICAPSESHSDTVLMLVTPAAGATIKGLTEQLGRRLEQTLPTFKAREPLLSMRRTAFSIRQGQDIAWRVEIGKSWLTSARTARKAGYAQTAYSATLQARKCDAPFAFIQSCKLLRVGGEPIRALQELDNALASLNSGTIDLTDENDSVLADDTRTKAKALTLQARWMHEADRFEHGDIISKFQDASQTAPRLESPNYHLGHFYDEKFARMSSHEKQQHSMYNHQTCKLYAKALCYGSKYIYQTMPRMLTLWLDMGDEDAVGPSVESGPNTQRTLQTTRNKITETMERITRRLPAWQWLTAFPQVVSRIGHPDTTTFNVLSKIMVIVLREYPQQALWLLTSAHKSKKAERAKRCEIIFNHARAGPTSSRNHLTDLIAESVKMTTELLNLSDFVVPNEEWTLSMSRHFRELNKLAPSRLILPLQDSMIVTLPPISAKQDLHQPFPNKAPVITEFLDEIEIMRSLQKPRKIVIKADDGQTYRFLCKPKDDLRKDARLMDFNSMINKLLKTNSESRRRQLHIRTYGVIPLNEECGCLEWVPNTVGLRHILVKAYDARGIKTYTPQISDVLDKAKLHGDVGKAFQMDVLPQYPSVFHEWFLSTFPEPSAWLSSRLAYARTAAVMSMVGFILGLGDRHGENILFDYLSGDTVHVDFNCLFEKGRTFEIPERVPFRLTHNMVDGLGVTGVEGVFRVACEITMELLRTHKDSLMSVLEAFTHDPLSEWEEEKKRREREARSRQGQLRGRRVVTNVAADGKIPQLRELAKQSLGPIERKLKGILSTTDHDASEQRQISAANQVEALIREATSPTNLGSMYVGWAAWM